MNDDICAECYAPAPVQVYQNPNKMMKKERIGGGYSSSTVTSSGKAVETVKYEECSQCPFDQYVKLGRIEISEQEMGNMKIVKIEKCNGNSGYQIVFTIGNQQCVIKRSARSSQVSIDKVVAKKVEEKKPVHYEVIQGNDGLF